MFYLENDAFTYLHCDTGQVGEEYRMKEWRTCCLQVKTTGSGPNPWGTTNLAFEEWAEIFGSVRLIGVLLDRLTHQFHILEANGESYRFRQASDQTGNPLPGRMQSRNNPQEKGK
jgi:IstB-like ATP binding protein